MISTIADNVLRQINQVQDTVSEALFEPVIRLGVTGLSRSGKTVFITSLVANLLDRGRMPHLRAVAEKRIEAVYLQPQPSDTLPRFDFERYLSDMTGKSPHWPEGTRGISELRVSFKLRSGGLFGGLRGPRHVHLDIIDYPGEWLLDLGLLGQSYAQWSASVLERLQARPEAETYLAKVQNVDASAPHDEVLAQSLAVSFTQYLNAARAAGYYDCTPGRFLLPGDLAGSPVLTFAPIAGLNGARKSLGREMERRYEAYKSKVIAPFFRDHFARIDRQVVLIDALGAIHAGPQSVQDLSTAMGAILAAFRPGQNSFLTQIFAGKRVEKILFAATKADHIHHSEHAKLSAFMEALLRDASGRAAFKGAQIGAMPIAALRCTTEDTIAQGGVNLNAVRGVLVGTGKQAALFPGVLPENPAEMIHAAVQRCEKWPQQDFQVMDFAPQANSLRQGDGPPHIRLDRAAEFLLGDRL